MSYKISSPEKFMTDIIPMEVLLTVCLALKYRNPDIEDLVLNIIPDWEDLDKYFVMDELASRLFNDQSFDSMIAIKKHKSDLISSISFLLKGCSSKKANLETEEYISSMDLNETNVFPAFCKSLLLLCEVFLSDHKHFSYENYNFDQDLVLISDLELNEIYNSNEIVEIDSNPIFGKSLENKFNVIDDKISKMESNFFKMESNLEKIMSLLVSMTSNDSKNPVSASNASIKIPSVFNAVKTPLVLESKKPKDAKEKGTTLLSNNTTTIRSFSSSKKSDSSDSISDSSSLSAFSEDSSLGKEKQKKSDNHLIDSDKNMKFFNRQKSIWIIDLNSFAAVKIYTLNTISKSVGLLLARPNNELYRMNVAMSVKSTSFDPFIITPLGRHNYAFSARYYWPRCLMEMKLMFAYEYQILVKTAGSKTVKNTDFAVQMLANYSTFQSEFFAQYELVFDAKLHITQHATFLLIYVIFMNAAVVMNNPGILTSFNELYKKYFAIEVLRTKSIDDLKDAMLFIKYSCDSCRALGFHGDCCPNATCYQKQKINDLTPGEQLSAAYKEYRALKSTSDFEKLEKIKNSSFNLYENFKSKLYKPGTGKSTKNLKPFNEHLQHILVNQDKLSVPGVYKNSIHFSDI